MSRSFHSEESRNTLASPDAVGSGITIYNIRKPHDVPGDIMVRIKSVLVALAECIDKIKISSLMAYILAESKTVCQILDNTHYQECADSLREFIIEMRKHTQPTVSMRNDPSLYRVIDAFQNQSQVLDIIGHLFLYEDIGISSSLSAWSIVYDLANIRMYKDPRGELELERKLHKVYWENSEFNNFYKKFYVKTIKGRNKLQWRIAAKEAIVTQIENQFSHDKAMRQHQFRLAEKVAVKQLQETQKACQNKKRDIIEDLQKTNDSYNRAVKDDYKAEMDVRAERNKLMLQLQALIRRYDTVMLEKKKTVLTLTEKLKHVQEDFDEFYKFYLQKEEIHNEIERKREEEFKAKVDFFTQTRAAKIIQKAWKRFIKILRKERAEEAKQKQKKK